MTDIRERQRARFYIYKKQKNAKRFYIHKKQDTSQKAGQFPLQFYIQKAWHFTSRDFLWKFEVGVYIQKAWHFALRDVFIYKRPDTSQKARQFALGFIYKIWTLCITRFLIEFLKLAELGEHFYMQKTMHFALWFYLQKVWHFALHFYIQKTIHFALHFLYKNIDNLRYIFICKKNALCVTFLYLKCIV